MGIGIEQRKREVVCDGRNFVKVALLMTTVEDVAFGAGEGKAARLNH